jgi:hypothetical protein
MRQNPDGFEVSILEKVYFMIFFAYYTVDLLFVWTSSEPALLLCHHIVTLSEVGACVVLQSPVVGLSVMLLHDITDVPLYIGKVLMYLRVQVLPQIMLATFAVSVTWFRIVNFPIVVWNVFVVGRGTEIHPKLYHFETMCLVVLFGMHIFWEVKILRAVKNALKSNEVTDQRSASTD